MAINEIEQNLMVLSPSNVPLEKKDLIEYSEKGWVGRIIYSIQLWFANKGWLNTENIVSLLSHNPSLRRDLQDLPFFQTLLKTIQVGKDLLSTEKGSVSSFSPTNLPTPLTERSITTTLAPTGKDIMTDEQLWQNLIQKTLPVSYLNQEFTLKNGRFNNIHCPARTAVQVKDPSGNTLYLHANRVGDGISSRAFVAGQAPHPKKQPLFWQFAFEQTKSILDLTTAAEQIEPYYPTQLNETQTYGKIEVTLTQVSTQDQIKIYSYTVKDLQTGKDKIIQRIHFDQWKDHQATEIGNLIELVDQLDLATSQGTPYVHCRAGVGRTGMLITASVLKEKIQAKEIDADHLDEELINLIVSLRQQRGEKFVQKLEQFSLLRQYGRQLLIEEAKVEEIYCSKLNLRILNSSKHDRIQMNTLEIVVNSCS